MSENDGDGSLDGSDGQIGLVLVTHGAVGQALLDTLEHVVGAQENIIPVSILPDDDVEVTVLVDIRRSGGGDLRGARGELPERVVIPGEDLQGPSRRGIDDVLLSIVVDVDGNGTAVGGETRFLLPDRDRGIVPRR